MTRTPCKGGFLLLNSDMDKTYHFITGMPRSGSTLLCNVLCQNPRFRATGTSPAPQLLNVLNKVWNNSNEAKANYSREDKVHLLKTVFENYHVPFPQEVVFDKSRGWTGLIEMLEQILERKPKMIACTRSIPDVVASFEKIWRKELSHLSDASTVQPHMASLDKRIEFWTNSDNVIGAPYQSLKDAVDRGHKDSILRVDYYDLTMNPRKTLAEIHNFIEEPWFNYNFDHVEQVIVENDEFHGFSKDALHKIRTKVEYNPSDAHKVLGMNWVNQLNNTNFNFLD